MDEKKDTIDHLISHMYEQAPTGFVSRKQIHEFTGGLLKKQHLANLDSQKKGISGRMMAGTIVVYPISEVERFLRNHYLKAI